jgi:cytochrome P450
VTGTAIARRALHAVDRAARGDVPAFLADRTGFLEQRWLAHGNVVPLRLGPHKAVLLNDPADIERVLVHESEFFPKLFVLRNRLRAGDTAEPEQHYWPRADLARAAFHREYLAAYAATMTDAVERMVATWADGDTRDILPDMLGLTLTILVRCLFDAEVRAWIPGLHAAMDDLLAELEQRLRWMLLRPDWWPAPANLRAKRAARYVESLLTWLIPDGVADRPQQAPLLALLHAASAGRPIDYSAARREALALAVAGHESSALTLTWLCHLLAHHPDVAARLEAEVEVVLNGRAPTPADRARLPYTQMVIHETLRLYPPVWVMTRRAARATSFGGVPVAAGTIVLVSQWLAQRNPEHFAEPDQFRPERWAEDARPDPPRYAYFPFAGGPRACPGGAFAVHELLLAVPVIVQRVRLAPAPGQVVALAPSFTLRPRHGLRMVIHRRA